MKVVPAMMSKKLAVEMAIEQLGLQTSLNVLCALATTIWMQPHNNRFGFKGRKGSVPQSEDVITPTVACIYRKAVARAKKAEILDCRTYEGQPRRNMLNDERTDLPQIKRLRTFLSQHGKSALADLRRLIGDGLHRFHSLEQLENAASELEELQLVA
jgi:hypothetical protein